MLTVGETCLLSRKGWHGQEVLFPDKKRAHSCVSAGQLPLDAPPSLLSNLQVAVCSPDFFSFFFPAAPAPALLLLCGWALGLAGRSTASPPDPLLSSLLGAVYSICSFPPPHPPFPSLWLPASVAASLHRNLTEMCWNNYRLPADFKQKSGSGWRQGTTWTPLSTWRNQLFICCRKVKPWSVKKQRTYPPASSIVKAFSLLPLLLVSLWVMNKLFYFIFCVL